jgi:uroporphyrinogen decarboxylase
MHSDEVRQEVRFLIDTYYKKEGLFMLTAGNGVNDDCPVESLRVLFDEAFKYGTK